MKLSWSILFPPINLWSLPKQFRDYNMQLRNIAADNRANSLKLKPQKRNTNPRCKVTIEPARGISHTVQYARIRDCIDQRNGVKIRG